MGFPPSVVDDMSLWQFRAVLVGWAAAHGAETDAGIDAATFDAAAAALDAAPVTTR